MVNGKLQNIIFSFIYRHRDVQCSSNIGVNYEHWLDSKLQWMSRMLKVSCTKYLLCHFFLSFSRFTVSVCQNRSVAHKLVGSPDTTDMYWNEWEKIAFAFTEHRYRIISFFALICKPWARTSPQTSLWLGCCVINQQITMEKSKWKQCSVLFFQFVVCIVNLLVYRLSAVGNWWLVLFIIH